MVIIIVTVIVIYAWCIVTLRQGHQFFQSGKILQSVPGQNVYGILRARRASSTESIVLSMPLRQKESDMPSTTGSMVLMLALAKFFRRKFLQQ